MRYLFYTALVSVSILAACSGEKKGSEPAETGHSDSAPAHQESMAERTLRIAKNNILGFYVGDFRAEEVKGDGVKVNRITISIDSLSDGQLFGHSIVAGNFRPFTGEFTLEGAQLSCSAKEPGDDKYDGSFTFTVDTTGSLLNGTWEANDDGLQVTHRFYTLDKRNFVYNANNDLPSSLEDATLAYPEIKDDEYYSDEYISSMALEKNPSTDELTKEDVENLFKGDLELMRNSIYARHGYSFRNRRWRFIFDHNVNWYVPVSVDVRKDLTELEVKNIALIQQYEEHAEEYYDAFGR